MTRLPSERVEVDEKKPACPDRARSRNKRGNRALEAIVEQRDTLPGQTCALLKLVWTLER